MQVFSFDYGGTLDAYPRALTEIIRGLYARGNRVAMVTGARHANGVPIESERAPREEYQRMLAREGITIEIHYCEPDFQRGGKSKLSVCDALDVALHFDNDQRIASVFRAARIPIALTGKIVRTK